jgi:hypothetical protein
MLSTRWLLRKFAFASKTRDWRRSSAMEFLDYQRAVSGYIPFIK